MNRDAAIAAIPKGARSLREAAERFRSIEGTHFIAVSPEYREVICKMMELAADHLEALGSSAVRAGGISPKEHADARRSRVPEGK